MHVHAYEACIIWHDVHVRELGPAQQAMHSCEWLPLLGYTGLAWCCHNVGAGKVPALHWAR